MYFNTITGNGANAILKYFFTNKFHFNFKKCHLLIRNEKS